MDYDSYVEGKVALNSNNKVWTLTGAGFDHFGINDSPVNKPLPLYKDDEILVRHDTVGLCGADVKLILLGQQHPRVIYDLATNPTVVGHEVSLTVVGVGKLLQDRFQVGQRFIVQPDIYYQGKPYGYGFALQGGLSQYAVLDKHILNGDAGCYLLPVPSGAGYAASAIVEALAAVVAAYRLSFRSTLKTGGNTWIVGTPLAKSVEYNISRGFDETSHPAHVYLSCVPSSLEIWIRKRSAELGIEVTVVNDLDSPLPSLVDDLILLGADADLIEKLTPRLDTNGVLGILDNEPLNRKVRVDMGRVHYDRWVLAGASSTDIADIYITPPTRSNLKPHGRAWFVGCGGPIGRSHVQYALQISDGPRVIFCTDLSTERIALIRQSYSLEATQKGIHFVCANPKDPDYKSQLSVLGKEGFDDIVVCAPSADAIAEAHAHLAKGGVINIFAGVAKGTMVEVDLSNSFLQGVRVIGFSGSTIEDMRVTLQLIERGEFDPNRLVMAIGSLEAAKEGLVAVQNSLFSGKIVIYNHIKPFPITPLVHLKEKLPNVYKKLKNGREWTNEAEQEFLKTMLV